MNQNIAHINNVQISVGIIIDVALAKFALPPTLFVKNKDGFAPSHADENAHHLKVFK